MPGVTDISGLCAQEALGLAGISCSFVSGTLFFFFECHRDLKLTPTPYSKGSAVFLRRVYKKR